MPTSDRIVRVATDEVTRQGISDLASQKAQEAEWSRIRTNFKEPCLEDFKRTIIAPDEASRISVTVGESKIGGADASTIGAGSPARGGLSSNLTVGGNATVHVGSDRTITIFEGPKWMQTLAAKKQTVLSAKEPLVRPDPSTTLEELVNMTTCGSSGNTVVSLGCISPLRDVGTRDDATSGPAAEGATPGTLLNEDLCAWKRCLWLQQQHQRQCSPLGKAADADNAFAGNCTWMRALEAIRADGDDAQTPR